MARYDGVRSAVCWCTQVRRCKRLRGRLAFVLLALSRRSLLWSAGWQGRRRTAVRRLRRPVALDCSSIAGEVNRRLAELAVSRAERAVPCVLEGRMVACRSFTSPVLSGRGRPQRLIAPYTSHHADMPGSMLVRRTNVFLLHIRRADRNHSFAPVHIRRAGQIMWCGEFAPRSSPVPRESLTQSSETAGRGNALHTVLTIRAGGDDDAFLYASTKSQPPSSEAR